MIKAILIDDERPALKGLEIMLKKHPEIRILAMFTNPLAALREMKALSPQVVFLDINMPQLQGMDAASQILDSCPDTDIVFVTAYDHYAIEAFELHALDYLLKPLAEDRLAITVERLLHQNKVERKTSDKTLQIKCLGGLQVSWLGQEPLKWRTEKTKEIFSYLLYNRGRSISKEELLDRLWPEGDPEKAIRHLYNGIYYIRKALSDYGIGPNLISIDSNYHLRLDSVLLDVKRYYEFEQGHLAENITELEQLAALYDGDFLESDDYEWAAVEREKLTTLYERCLLKLAQMLIADKQWAKAEKYLKIAYHKNPYAEEISELILKLYQETGNKAKAVRHFNSYVDLLQEELGISPPARLQELLQNLE